MILGVAMAAWLECMPEPAEAADWPWAEEEEEQPPSRCLRPSGGGCSLNLKGEGCCWSSSPAPRDPASEWERCMGGGGGACSRWWAGGLSWAGCGCGGGGGGGGGGAGRCGWGIRMFG